MCALCRSLFTAVRKVIEKRLALVLTLAIHAALHALEGKRVLVRTVGLGETRHVMNALEEVRDLRLGSLWVASSTIWAQSSLTELLHFALAQSSILEAIDERLQSKSKVNS